MAGFLPGFFTSGFSFLISAGAVLLLFGGTVLVHEWGHFITAKWFGLRIDAFSIGMGPALWQRKVNGVVYKISLLPIGGYVALPQMDITGSAFENEDAKEGRLEPVPPWQRIVIALAGPFMNVVTAFILCLLVWWIGKPADPGPGPAEIGQIRTESAAFEAGLREGDVVRRVNGDRVHFWADLQIAAMLNEKLDLKVVRDGEIIHIPHVPTEVNPQGFLHLAGVGPVETDLISLGVHRALPDSPADRAGLRAGDTLLQINDVIITNGNQFIETVQAVGDEPITLTVRPRNQRTPRTVELQADWDEAREQWMIGISMQAEFAKVHPAPLTQMQYFQGSIFRTLRAFTRRREMGRAAQGVGGPVMILSGMHSQVRFHPMQALWFTALINVNLAIINLLPFIVLDGGHIMVALFEWITGRKPYRRLIVGLANIMVAVLIALMVVLSVRDVSLLRRIYGDNDENSDPAPREQVEETQDP